MKTLLWLFAALCVTCAQAQTVTVRDKSTREHMPGVIIQSKTKGFASTNNKGKVDISQFAGEDSLTITYTNYKPIVTSYEQLKSADFKIDLEPSNIALTEVMVSADRWEDEKIEKPNRVEKLDMKEVAFQNPQTTADVLGTSGYAYIQKSQLGGGSPMLRGMATNRVLLVVDGVRMNNAIFRAGNLQNVISLDANALESTEIIFGPGSVMYGSDAIGGVMNFGTLSPKFRDTLDHKRVVSGNALLRTSTANSELTAHLDVNVALKKWAFVTSATYSDYDDLRSGTVGGVNSFYRSRYIETVDGIDQQVKNNDSALQVGSAYSQINCIQKLSYRPNRFLTVDYALHLSQTSNYNRYDRLYVERTSGANKGNLRFAEWYYGPQIWNMNRAGITHSKPTVLYDKLNLIGALQNFEESRYDREFRDTELRMQRETVRALSLNLDLDKKLFGKTTLNYGAEFVRNKIGSFASLTDITTGETQGTGTRYPDGSTWASLSGYASVKYRVTPKFSVNGGLRYSYYMIDATFDTTYYPFPFTSTRMRNGTLNGSIGFVYDVDRWWQVYVNGASGFRAPNIDDVGKVFESTPGYLVVPNTSLKPEHVYNAEIGTLKKFGNFLKFDMAVYYSWLKDAMERKDFEFNGQKTVYFFGDSSKVQAVQNVIKVRVYGVQAGLDLNYRGFGLRSTFSYQKGEEQTVDSLVYYPLRHAPPIFGSVHLTYERRKLKFDFYTNYNGKMEYEDLALTERVNPSYARDYSKDPKGLAYADSWYTLNFKAAFYAKRYLALMAGVENIADLLYRPYSSGINAPGRNFIFSVNAKF